MMGQADDWTPAKPCEALVARAKTLGGDTTFVGYPGAYHDFDAPDRPVTVLKGLAFTGAGAGGDAHTGTDPAARADALRRVPQFLAR
jgi:dienelactone hydrolase